MAQGLCREEVTAAVWHLGEGMSLFWVLLGAFTSQVVQPGPGGNPNLTSINLHEKRSVEEKPQARLAAPGVCADPPGLQLPWLPAPGVGESSALGCPHPLQDADGSPPAQQILWLYNTEPPWASLHLLKQHLSSPGPWCFLVAGMGSRSFSFYFPLRAAKGLFLLDGYAREESRGGITNKNTRTGQGSTAPHSVP